MTGQARKFGKNICNSSLTVTLARISYSLELTTHLFYPLPENYITEKASNKILQPALPKIKWSLRLPITVRTETLFIKNILGVPSCWPAGEGSGCTGQIYCTGFWFSGHISSFCIVFFVFNNVDVAPSNSSGKYTLKMHIPEYSRFILFCWKLSVSSWIVPMFISHIFALNIYRILLGWYTDWLCQIVFQAGNNFPGRLFLLLALFFTHSHGVY